VIVKKKYITLLGPLSGFQIPTIQATSVSITILHILHARRGEGDANAPPENFNYFYFSNI